MHTTEHTDFTKLLKASQKRRFSYDKKTVFSFLFVLGILAVYYRFVGCPIRSFTGIPCLGCGMTRACYSILKGDFAAAFYFHPLWPCPPLFIVFYLFLRSEHRKLYNILLSIMICLFIVVYIVRVIVQSPIVEADISSGLIYQAISYIMHLH